jgi:hypothetical protein
MSYSILKIYTKHPHSYYYNECIKYAVKFAILGFIV